jgi:TatD DNase family protein
MPLVDSHAHLDSDRYAPDREAMLRRAKAAGVDYVVSIGIGDGPHEMHHALEIATQSAYNSALPKIFASAGIHPQEAAAADDAAYEKLAALTQNPRCIAIGEIGLDYYHAENPPMEIQKAAFIRQMEIAKAAQLPIILHCRTSEGATPEAHAKFGDADAQADLLTLLETHWRPTGLGGIMHCFSGDVAHARASLNLGFLLSFAGNLTYPKAQSIRDAAVFAPEDRILVETDAPFLAPIPNRGQRNEPAWVAHTAARLAELRNQSIDQIAHATTENFFRLFPKARALR